MSEDIKVTDGTVLETLNGKVDIDFDNVASNSVGFARCSTEVTNCITEIPQRIKYTLVDGTLTIKAGSVVIVPYGVEDLTSQYPVGATFLHENFKVYDTQFEDGKFFVWAEIQSDIVRNATTGTDHKRMLCIVINKNNTSNNANTASGDGSNLPTSSSYYYYNTSTNLIVAQNSGTLLDEVQSLPLMLTQSTETYNVDSILQVFNGIGYIGSTVWVDKGVKGLIPNGRNEDGTLRNIEWSNNSIKTCQTHDARITEPYIDIETDELKVSTTSFGDMYDKETNYFIYNDNKFLPLVLGSFYTASGTKLISNFQPNQPLRLATTDMVDGQWVNKYLQLGTDLTFNNANDQIFDLSDYLPNDGYNYEVIVSTHGRSGTASGNNIDLGVFSDIIPLNISGGGGVRIGGAITRTSNFAFGSGALTMPIGKQRIVGLHQNSTGTCTNVQFRAYAYRRIGTNV